MKCRRTEGVLLLNRVGVQGWQLRALDQVPRQERLGTHFVSTRRLAAAYLDEAAVSTERRRRCVFG
jgi:hypothetical protein